MHYVERNYVPYLLKNLIVGFRPYVKLQQERKKKKSYILPHVKKELYGEKEAKQLLKLQEQVKDL